MSKKERRQRFLLAACQAARSMGNHEATMGGISYTLAPPTHPEAAGTGVVQHRVKGREVVELAQFWPQVVQDQGGVDTLIYWARPKGTVNKVFVMPDFLLAVVRRAQPCRRPAERAGEEGTQALL